MQNTFLKETKKDFSENKQIIVIGRGRCGTSLVAGILDTLGVDMMPGRLNKPKKEGENVYGYFENGDFHKIFKNPPGVAVALKGYKNKEGIWGWKDHRSLYFIDEILCLLPNVHFIVCERDIDAQARSMAYHLWGNKRSKEDIKEKIKGYNRLLAMELKRHEPRHLRVKFEKLIENPEKEVKRIAKFIGLAYNEDASKLVDGKLPLYL